MPAKSKAEMTTRRQDKARRDRQDAKARARCIDAVWKRAGDSGDGLAWCDVCRWPVTRVLMPDTFPARYGHVHEMRARSLGGDPHNPDECQLLCHSCHFNGPSGAHRRSVRESV